MSEVLDSAMRFCAQLATLEDGDPEMTREEATQLSVGRRVCWRNNKDDAGTVETVTRFEVTIRWDDGSSSPYFVNEMRDVAALPPINAATRDATASGGLL